MQSGIVFVRYLHYTFTGFIVLNFQSKV